MKLPFRRLAILPPSIIHSDAPKILEWVNSFFTHKADGVYLRLKGASPDEIKNIWRACRSYFLQHNIFIILPAAHRDSGIPFHALQYSDTETPEVNAKRSHNLCMSCHSKDGIQRAEDLRFDFVFLSPVFATSTHENAEPLGIEYLKESCVKSKLPIVALGGINSAEEERKCFEAGAAAIAGIRLFLS